MEFRIPLQFLLLLLSVRSIDAFTYSCSELKHQFMGANFADSLTYACVVIQEGFTNLAELENIHLTAGADVYSFADISRSKGHCVARKTGTSWKLTSIATADCTQEFTLILSSVYQNIYAGPQQYFSSTTTVVVPQTGMRLLARTCFGSGNFSVSTGAGTGTKENRYEYQSWTCDSISIPSRSKWIVVFDNVITITMDKGVDVYVECSSDLTQKQLTSPGHTVAVLSSGKSNDQQNLQGTEHRAIFGINNYVSINMLVTLDSSNTGYVGLRKTRNSVTEKYYNGAHTDGFYTDYFEVSYVPKGLKPEDIYYNSDLVIVEGTIGGLAPTTKLSPTTVVPKTTTKPIQRTTIPAKTTTRPVQITTAPTQSGQGQYCNCAVDKFGFPNGWSYNDIWLDIVVILDTSEAMGEESLEDAGALIESFISDGVDDFLITDPKASYYTRLGVIAMSDSAQVLYNLNMTKADKVQGKATVKKGVKQIDIIEAFDAALIMFSNGLKTHSDREGTRQVIYYMTASNPGSNQSPINQFKTSQGVIIVDDFVEEGAIQLNSLKELASDGYYFTNSNYMKGLQAFCKANCFCQPSKDSYLGTDPAVSASGGCFHPATAGVPFNKAKTTCTNEGGIVATIHDDKKGRFLQGLMTKASSKSDYFWMGYEKSDTGNWQWDDQSTDPYTNWDVDEPNSAPVSKCAYVDTTTKNLAWGAGNCQIGFPYVCEYAPCSTGYKNC